MVAPARLIAVLDDEPELLRAVRRLLTGCGFRVETLSRGADLLAALDRSFHPDCLVLDLHMPEMSGVDILAAMHERRLSIPVIVVTAHDGPGIEELCRRLGVKFYLRKPVGRDALLAAIDAVLVGMAESDRRPDDDSPKGGRQ